MMNLDHMVQNFCNQENTLGQRMRLAVNYRDAAMRGEISPAELLDLMQDLQRLDSIQLNASELDQQIAFQECFDMLMSLPL